MKLLFVKCKTQQLTPLFTSPTDEFRAYTEEKLSLEKVGEMVVVTAATWQEKALVIPWSEVRFAHVMVADLTAPTKPPIEMAARK